MSKNNLSISKEEILDLLVTSYKQGVCSYYDLASESCSELLNEFLQNKMQPPKFVELSVNNTTISLQGNLNFPNFDTYVGNVFVS